MLSQNWYKIRSPVSTPEAASVNGSGTQVYGSMQIASRWAGL